MRLRNKLFSFGAILIIASVIITSSLVIALMYNSYQESVRHELISYLHLIDSSNSDPRTLDFDQRRFTVIDQSGKVIFDSVADESVMENHIDRPEIQDAIRYGTGHDTRLSGTLTESMFYVAILSEEGYVLRISERVSSVYAFLLTSLPYISIVIILVIALSLILSVHMSKRIVEPINKIDLERPLDDDAMYEELSTLARRIDEQNKKIKEQMALLERDKNELSLIVKSMKDGLILARRGGEILMINDAAKTLMGKNTSDEFKTLIELSHEELFFNVMEKGGAQGRIKVEGRTVEVHAEEVEGLGSAILLFDVSDKLQLEMKEREFIQNVSHELKTPMTSISGYSELIMRGQVDSEHIKEFSAQIFNEAKRLYQLIEDIMALSRMDEEATVSFETIDVNAICKDVMEAINNPIVKLSEHDSLKIHGNGTMIFEAIYNLVDNAIKYNRDNNPIKIIINKDSFSVKDEGIGLSPYDRERVFDRFYRVDKSRSRRTGGTGLGLSIVKSIAEKHSAKIDISSTLGEGTEIKLTFQSA